MPDTHALHGAQTVAYEPPQALHLLSEEGKRICSGVCGGGGGAWERIYRLICG